MRIVFLPRAWYKPAVPALVTILGAFVVILLLGRLRMPLAGAILIGAVVVGFGFRLPPLEVMRSMGEGLIRPRTIGLIAVTASLLALSGTMRSGGQMKRIVALTRALLRRPVVTMAALPALIGLLPMPGGALFSAPMVESAAGDEQTPAGKLSAINYWFRHVWEYWWPLYPGVILAMALTGRDFAAFATFQFPLSLMMIAAGLLILRKIHPNLRVSALRASRGTRRELIKVTSSIWMVLVVWAGVKVLLVATLGPSPRSASGAGQPAGIEAVVAAVHSYLPITLGLIVSQIWTVWANRLGVGGLGGAWMDRGVWRMALLVAGVMMFQYMLERVGGPGLIGEELKALKVPALAVVMILPFAAGMVTGMAVGFVGAGFPIVLGLVQNIPGPADPAPYIALAYLFGHMGQMLSPLHLCHIMSNEYFKVGFRTVYRQIIPAALLLGAMGIGYFFCLRSILSWL